MLCGPLPAILLFSHLWFTPILARPAAPQEGPSSEAVNAAIERGVGFLLRSQNRDGSWGVDLNERGTPWHDLRDGACSLAAYTLLKCGFTPEHPAIHRAGVFLAEGRPVHTYATGIQLHTLGGIDPKGYRKRMQQLVESLLDLRQANGWDYPGIGRPDLSNTQVAALGFRAADAAGLALPKSLWSDLVEVALRYQESPVEIPGTEHLPKAKRRMAGFFYIPGSAPSASMTTAGLTILGIASEDPTRLGHRLEAKIAEASELALNWFEQNYSVEKNIGGEEAWHLYYLYGLERVGALFGKKEIAGHDWYQEGAAELIRSQKDDGRWARDGRTKWPPQPMPIANTCFALLFLRKATLSPTAGRREHFYGMEEADSDVWVRVDAKQVWTLWLSGFSQKVQGEDGRGVELFVERVEWWLDDTRIGTVEGDPSRPWEGERFAMQYEPALGGEFALECRATLRRGDGQASELRSRTLRVRHELALEPWMLDYAQDAAKDSLDTVELTLSASSQESDFHPVADAVDGLQGSAWWAREDDSEPWVRIECSKGVRLKELLLSPAGASEVSREGCLPFHTVELRVNDSKKSFVIEMEKDLRLKTRFVLPKPSLVKSLELRIVDPPREEGKCVGWAEIEGR